jgi:DNA-binding transcriptional MocR family regulator
VSRITVRKAMQALEEEGVVTRARGYGTQINNIFEYSLKEARGFSAGGAARQKAQYAVGQQTGGEMPGRGGQPAVIAPESDVFCSSAFAMWMTMRCRLKSPGCRWVNSRPGCDWHLAV